MTSGPADPTAERDAAEASGDDLSLLYWHELDVAVGALPPVIDGARRTRLVHVDALATTWDAWDTHDGTRLLLRCVRLRWKDDPVILRRMAKGVRGPRPPEWRPNGDWPHLRTAIPGPPLHDRFPIEDPPSTAFLARVLGSALVRLGKFHDADVSQGGPLLHTLFEVPGGFDLAFVDPFPAGRTSQSDLSELANTIVLLDPEGEDPVTRLVEPWRLAPPPSAQDGLRLLSKTLASDLLDMRHRLSLVRRHSQRRSRVARLSRATTSLWQALHPPKGTWCLRAGPGSLLVVLESDGRVVRGGAATSPDARFLPCAFDPQSGLDAQHTRFLLRSWAAREQDGDEASRARIQAELGSDDQTLVQLLRWLGNMARLRAARLLLRETA